MKKLSLIFVSLFILASCGNKERLKVTDRGDLSAPDKSPGGGASDGEDAEPSVIFADVLAEIFDNKSTCTECHNGFIEPQDYSSYAEVKKDINKILREVLSDSMPQFGPPLSSEQKELLQEWAALGAPES